MSQYVTAFLTLNLGVEMVYVIAQRLNAQNIAQDRSAFVLNEIISVLVSKELIMDIMKPQTTYSQGAIKDIIENVAQSSIMRLDATSMDKLWDLITMVFKWQTTLCSDVLKVTQRHVNALENYVSNGEILLQLRRVENLVDNFRKILSKNELATVRDEILSWLKYSNIKVSLLLKMGLQNTDGSFVINDNDDRMKSIVENLGENVYSLNQGDKNAQIKRKESVENSNEVDLLVDQLLGEERFKSSTPNRNLLRLNIGNGQNIVKANKRDSFQNIRLEQNDNILSGLLTDLNINDNTEGTADFKEDLLKLIGDDGTHL